MTATRVALLTVPAVNSQIGHAIMTARRFLSVLVVALVGVGSVAVAAPASAALGYCNSYDPREGNTGVPYSTASGTNSCYLVAGVTGTGVKALQEAMVGCYGEAIAVDSSFGPATKAALKRTQAKLGIAVDGSYGPQTHNAMLFHGYANGSGAGYCVPAFYKA
ncbi:MAG TPA: peptidoglycan-binding domain-containing protein [Cellulomonas sp.]|nr:peptidoglycan-binding domain-containing protein [Cellulomonas sp.]